MSEVYLVRAVCRRIGTASGSGKAVAGTASQRGERATCSADANADRGGGQRRTGCFQPTPRWRERHAPCLCAQRCEARRSRAYENQISYHLIIAGTRTGKTLAAGEHERVLWNVEW